jgi:hypothetical protein
MIIKENSLIVNKTKKYLYPIIRYYGNNFLRIINSFFKVGIGIDDLVLEKSDIRHLSHLFILINVRITYAQGIDFYHYLYELREYPYYEDDYRYDLNGTYHMIVIKIPDACISSLEQFKKSKFSKMFTNSEIDFLFSKGDSITKSILKKDSSYKDSFRKILAEEFIMKEEDIHPNALEGELEFNMCEHEEKFNFNLLGE